MLSKWLPWDFFKRFGDSIQRNRPGLYTLWAFDQFMVRIFQNNLPTGIFEGGKIFVLMGKDISRDWVEANLMSLTFFGGGESFFVHNAEDIPKEAQELLASGEIDFSSRFFILSFSSDCPFRKKLVDKIDGEHIVINAPPFWEGGKLLDFIADQNQVRLSFDARNYILMAVEHQTADFQTALNMLKLNYPEHSQLTLEQVQSLLKISRLDQFTLASLFSCKKKMQFFEHLLNIDNDFDDLRTFFSFMQSHLIKIFDTSYTEKKARPSKYDREIINYSRLWDKDELSGEIRKFGEWEILAKMRSEQLLTILRAEYLQTMSS